MGRTYNTFRKNMLGLTNLFDDRLGCMSNSFVFDGAWGLKCQSGPDGVQGEGAGDGADTSQRSAEEGNHFGVIPLVNVNIAGL